MQIDTASNCFAVSKGDNIGYDSDVDTAEKVLKIIAPYSKRLEKYKTEETIGREELMTAAEALVFAEENCNVSEFLREENSEDDIGKRRKFLFKDIEYGFEYSVMDRLNIDNGKVKSAFTDENWGGNFYKYVIEQIEADIKNIGQKYGAEVELQEKIQFTLPEEDPELARIKTAAPENEEPAARELAALFEKYDTKGYWNGRAILCENGRYIVGEDIWYTDNADKKTAFMIRAKQLNPTAEYAYPNVRLKRFKNSEFVGKAAGMADDDTVTYYYFRTAYSGPDFYIADIKDDNGNYYTNYYEKYN